MSPIIVKDNARIEAVLCSPTCDLGAKASFMENGLPKSKGCCALVRLNQFLSDERVDPKALASKNKRQQTKQGLFDLENERIGVQFKVDTGQESRERDGLLDLRAMHSVV
jgi:hypothetical protein